MNDVWTIKRVLDWTVGFFGEKQIPEARLSAEILLGKVLNCKRMDLYVHFERILSPKELAAYRGFIQRRAKHEPVQYITGEQEFMGLNFRLTPDVLIPRFDTEILVEQAQKELREAAFKPGRILDIGSGSGIIACALAAEFADWQITGIDISEDAVNIAGQNARHLDLKNVHFQKQDAFTYSVPETEKYQMIVSNPPYIAELVKNTLAPQVLNFEPAAALFAGTDGMDFYKTIIPRLSAMLTPEGIILLEIGYDQGEKVSGLLKTAGFYNIKILKDFQKLDRVIRANI